jgi:hypothetical protein
MGLSAGELKSFPISGLTTPIAHKIPDNVKIAALDTIDCDKRSSNCSHCEGYKTEESWSGFNCENGSCWPAQVHFVITPVYRRFPNLDHEEVSSGGKFLFFLQNLPENMSHFKAAQPGSDELIKNQMFSGLHPNVSTSPYGVSNIGHSVYMGRDYYFLNEKQADGSYQLILVSGSKSQRLATFPNFGNPQGLKGIGSTRRFYVSSLGLIRWAGDMDGDGKLDLVIEQPELRQPYSGARMNDEFRLYLSSLAGPNQLVGIKTAGRCTFNY